MKHVITVVAFALMSSGLAQVSNHVPEEGLRYWSDFDGSVADQSVYHTSTSLFGAVPTVDRNGTMEGAMFFDGVDDHVKLFEVEGGVTFEDELTLVAWMKAEEFLGVQHPRLFHSSEGVGGGFDRWFFTWSPLSASSVVGFGVGNGQNSTVVVDSQNSVTSGEWHHVAAIFQNGLVKVMVDGVLESEAPLSFTSLSHIEAPVFLGSALGNSHFHGALDEVGIWDRALSVEEIEVLSQWTPYGCTYAEACNYDFQAEIEDGTCDFTCLMMGCGDLAAINYDPYANDGSDDDCLYIGCQDELALNYSVTANYPGECIYLESCPGDYSDDGVVDITDLLDFFQLYGGECELVDEIWSCGTPLGYQGYDYSTVQIGGQCWFSENLRSEDYRNGETISAGLSADEWGNSPTGAVASFQESVDSLEVYGRLYNWFAVVDSRGLCPSNWHVATDDEWKELEMSLGMSPEDTDGTYWRGSDQGTQLKSSNGWREDGDGTNTSGFSALPGGFRTAEGEFIDTYGNGYWWSSSASNSNAWSRHLDWVDSRVYRLLHSQNRGYSVRCLKDSE